MWRSRISDWRAFECQGMRFSPSSRSTCARHPFMCVNMKKIMLNILLPMSVPVHDETGTDPTCISSLNWVSWLKAYVLAWLNEEAAIIKHKKRKWQITMGFTFPGKSVYYNLHCEHNPQINDGGTMSITNSLQVKAFTKLKNHTL